MNKKACKIQLKWLACKVRVIQIYTLELLLMMKVHYSLNIYAMRADKVYCVLFASFCFPN